MGDEDAVAKKLSFMDAGVGVSMQDGALLKWRQQSSDTANGPHAANLRAVTDLRKYTGNAGWRATLWVLLHVLCVLPAPTELLLVGQNPNLMAWHY
jgi:hypothetical protein